MYRIHFDPNSARWVIQISWYSLMWRTAREDGTAVSFKTYEDARLWVDAVGLSKAYHELHERNGLMYQNQARQVI